MIRPPLIVPFTKMDGAGNDFIVLDNRFLHFTPDELAALAERFCPRRTGIGADGLLALEDDPDAAFRMRYRNADGSLGTMCGNGARCLARYAAEAGLGTRASSTVALTFETDGGRYRAEVPDTGDVQLDVPPPNGFSRADTEGDETVYRIWTGTEHAVLFVDAVDTVELATVGPRLRHDPAFAPTGTNVNAVQRIAADRIRVRTFEKGVEAETLACGTGALATALVSRLTDGVERTGRQLVAVEMPGGTLAVGFRLVNGVPLDLTLSGPARTVYSGTLEWTA
ncbi:MAG: diaminopimelate epimerase [Rubricoccaceae bacterium]